MNDIKQFPTALNSEKEALYVKRLCEGDLSVKQILIEHNLYLTAMIAKRYSEIQEEIEEYISVGAIGLMNAIGSYNKGTDVKFKEYIVSHIAKEIVSYKHKMQRDPNNGDIIHYGADGSTLSLDGLLQVDTADVVETRQMIKELMNAINSLSVIEKAIIERRNALNGHKPMTQQEIANVFFMTRSNVAYHEKKALIKISNALKDNQKEDKTYIKKKQIYI